MSLRSELALVSSLLRSAKNAVNVSSSSSKMSGRSLGVVPSVSPAMPSFCPPRSHRARSLPSRLVPIEIDVAKVARLARLALDDDDLARLGGELGLILEHAARVQSLPTDGVPPTSHPLPMVNSFRPDEVTPPLDRDEVLSQAPETEDGYFRVPRILDES